MTEIRQVSKAPADKHRHVEDGLAAIRDALLGLQFGSVTVTMHEDRIVQIDVTEKKRIAPKH
ncbi:YezD family protein [Allopontixanthobacter sp.]|uniref:YezD family protein n=1 Tax=Allopontixanthobacter sp. TaxID=2906452 RepID=UPI002AB9882C|nr:YezD family protein [Allopontixanthobacter sp.]MDZ4307897.1 YezD family protein [Allopontixanthobacter sp.]